MIDEEKTFKMFRYYSTDLTEYSNKKVVAICNDCGKERIILKYAYRDLCTSCCQIGKNNPNFGKKFSDEHRCKMSENHADFSGENSSCWNPNLTDKERGIKRNTFEYNTWVRAVKETNNFTCVKCNTCESELVAHHLFAYWKYPEARFIIGNGITLCKSCHNKFHRLYDYKYFTIDDFFIFCRDN